jgi:hypothetical protein
MTGKETATKLKQINKEFCGEHGYVEKSQMEHVYLSVDVQQFADIKSKTLMQ